MRHETKILKVLAAGLAMAGLVLSGCSGGVNSGATINPNTASTTTQTLITDAPAAQVLSLA